jgi:hypothetical protein
MDSAESSVETAPAVTGRLAAWRAAAAHEIRTHRITYVAVAAFCVLGPVLVKMVFPEASTPLVVFGGVVLGIHFAFCALADKLFE